MFDDLTGKALAASVAVVVSASVAHSHDLWVNALASYDAEAKTTAVVTSMGWGHMPLPIAEFLPGDRIETYAIVAPDGSVMGLPFDSSLNADVNMIPDDDLPAGLANIQGGDAFARRLVFDETAAGGAWRAHVALPPRVFSTWINASGEEVSGAQFEDEIEGATEIVSSAVTVRSSDSYWSIGDWAEPAPVDVPLQLIPLSDLSAVAAGDEVRFAVFRNGERVTPPAEASFGAFGVAGEATGTVGEDGELRVTLPEAGHWIIRSSHQEDLAAAGPDYADLEGRVDAVTFTATSAVHVGP